MSKKWTKDEMKYLTNNWSDKTKRPAVAKQLGRSVGACSAKLRAINKAQKEAKPPWVKAAEKVVKKKLKQWILLKTYHIKDWLLYTKIIIKPQNG